MVHQAFYGPDSIVQLQKLACGGREAMMMTPSPTCDSAVLPCFCGCLAFLHIHFPPQYPPSCPFSLSLRSTAALALGFLHNPQTPAPSCCAFQGTCVLVWGMYGSSKDCLILIPFRLSQISCYTLSLQCFSSDPDNCSNVGIGPLLQFPHLPRAGLVLPTLLFFPLVLLSYRVLRGSI